MRSCERLTRKVLNASPSTRAVSASVEPDDELPAARRKRYIETLGISEKDAAVLTADRPSSALSQGTTGQLAMVEIEPYTATPPEVPFTVRTWITICVTPRSLTPIRSLLGAGVPVGYCTDGVASNWLSRQRSTAISSIVSRYFE